MISVSPLGILQGPCAAESEPALLMGSKQFGLSKNSHIAIAFDDTKVKNRYVSFFDVRQKLTNGSTEHLHLFKFNQILIHLLINELRLFSNSLSTVKNRIMFV